MTLKMMHANLPIGAGKFERALPSIVKSIRQRDLLNSWMRLNTSKTSLPRLADYDTSRMTDDLIDMMTLEVVHTASGTRFRMIMESTTIDTGNNNPTQNTNDPVYLDMALGPDRYPIILPYYEACLAHRRPIYSFSMVNDDKGKEVSYERLLLPFGEADRLTHIVGSLKTISIEGGFKIKDLATLKAEQSVSITRAVIDGFSTSSRAD
jgi:hypothetical protein